MAALLKSLIHRQGKVLFFVALIAVVASCSFKTFYNQLDYLIPSYVEGLVSLDSMLEEKVEQRSLLLINWHRNTQLKQYADWLRALQRDANEHLTEAQILQHIATLETFWQSISLKLDEEMALLLPMLDGEQRQELFESLADKNENFREDYVEVDNDERREQHLERLFDNYEKWLGDLTDEQALAVEAAADGMLSSAGLRLQRRQQWQHSIQVILDSDDSAKQKSERLREFFAGFDMGDNAEMRHVEETNKLVLARLTVQIVHTMTEQQKTHFVSSTDDYIRMFTELAEGR